MPIMLQYSWLGYGCAVERFVDHLHHAFDILADLIVPDAKDPITFVFKSSRPFLVAVPIGLVGMLRSVDLDDESSGWTDEIGDVVAYRHLPSEVRASHLEVLEAAPKRRLGAG